MTRRKSISGVAATSLWLATEVDVHHVTVTKYELRLRAAQVAAMHAFFVVSVKERKLLAETDTGMRIRLHDIRADATNSSVIKRNKVHVVIVTHAFLGGVVHEQALWDELLETLKVQGVKEKGLMAGLHIVRPHQKPGPGRQAF